MVVQMAAATSNPEMARPTWAIRATQMGGKRTPPTLAPLRARLSAFGRSRSNQRATMALMAALLVVAQPAPVSSAAAKSCQGDCARDQVMTPSAHAIAPALVTAASG